MKTILFFVPALIFCQSCHSPKKPAVTRTVLQRYDLNIPQREMVQSVIAFDPGTSVGNHSHPGEEIIYVLEGSLEYEVEGNPTIILQAGEVLFIPAGKIHAAKNEGSGRAKELATYIVEKGKQLVIIQP